MTGQQPEHHPDVAVDMRRASWAGSRVVMDAGSLDVGPITLSRRVVERQGEPRLVGNQGLDHLVDQPSGYVVCLLAGCRDRRVAGLELAAQASGTDPTRDGPPATGQNRAEEQPHQPGGGSAIES